MKFEHQLQPGGCKILCYGNLCGTGVGEFKEFLDPFLKDVQLQEIILDMKDVNAIDSAGIGLLIRGHKILMEHKRKMQLANVSAKIQETLRMTGLNKFFPAV